MLRAASAANIKIVSLPLFSTVNNRQFSVVNNSDLDWKSEDIQFICSNLQRGSLRDAVRLAVKLVLRNSC